MSNKKLIKLEKIKYKNNDYRLFAGQTGRRIFFKIEDDGTYIYPDIRVYLELDKIYNHKDITLVYSKKDIKRKLIEGTLIITNITLLSLNVYNLVKDDFIENKITQSNYQSYNRVDYNTAITLAHQSEDILEILNNNDNLSDNEKKYIKTFIIYLQRQKQNLDLNIFKYNLKELKIIRVENEEFKEKYGENVNACFSCMEKTIFYKEKISPATLYHELGHLINVIYFEDKNLLYHVEGDSGFGNALYEGFNTFFTNSLLDQQDNAYTKEQCYIKIISEIIGSEEVEKCYFGNGDIVEKLSKYVEKEEVKRIIMMMDDLCITSKVKEINTKEAELEIAKKLLEWSRISAKKKYYELKVKNISEADLEHAYFYQLLNTDIFLSQAFGFDRTKIKELERSILDDSNIFKKYDELLKDDVKYLERLKEQNNFIANKKYFVSSIEQVTFEKIEEMVKEYNQSK